MQKKGGCRDHMQVVADGGLATLAAIGYGATGAELFLVLFAASMAESNADTWAREIGILSKKPPVCITDLLKKVQPGLSGGVTLLGTAASLVGSFVIALTTALAVRNLGQKVAIITISDFVGALVDSVLGATW
jgi:uncharacterized protein (TIGR00297 family)